MTIAAKGIASCSPIASQSCITAPLIADFFGDTSEVFEGILGIGLTAQFWGPQTFVYVPTLVDPDAARGDCIIVHAHYNIAVALPLDGDSITPVRPDDSTTPGFEDDVVAPPWQKCNKEAA